MKELELFIKEENTKIKRINQHKGPLSYAEVVKKWAESLVDSSRYIVNKWNNPNDIDKGCEEVWKLFLKSFLNDKKYIQAFLLDMLDESINDNRDIIILIYGEESKEIKAYDEAIEICKENAKKMHLNIN